MFDPGSTPTPSKADLPLCRSLIYQALAAGFRRPAAAAAADGLAGVETISRLARAAFALERDADGPLAQTIERLALAARPVEPLEVVYTRLFGHVAHGPVPLYETEYAGAPAWMQSSQLADLAGFYAAFGLRLDELAAERPDHLACECEFLAFLCLKEAFALEHGDQAMLEATAGARRSFLRDHLAVFGPALAHRLGRLDPEGHYGALAGLLSAWIEFECRALDLQLGPPRCELRDTSEERIPLACGSCASAEIEQARPEPE
jgi:DMSO reductase family type II enzyme chaperone